MYNGEDRLCLGELGGPFFVCMGFERVLRICKRSGVGVVMRNLFSKDLVLDIVDGRTLGGIRRATIVNTTNV